MAVSGWVWAAFIVFVTLMLVLDLGVFNRRARVVTIRESLWMASFWISLAGLFGLGILYFTGPRHAMDFLTGYVLEESLSVDNLFVFLIIFNYFKVPDKYRPKVLFWGIIGAVVLRAIFIITGVWLLEKFAWLIYVFGVFLIYSAFKLLFMEDEEVDPEKNVAIKALRRVLPVSSVYSDGDYFIRDQGRRIATPLFVVVVTLASTDLVFALDSIPTILGITQDRFIVFTSNIFAVMGLRSIFFAITGIMGLFHYLDKGLSAILLFIGVKMLLPLVAHVFHLPEHWGEIHPAASLAVVISILLIAIIASVIHSKMNPKDPTAEGMPPAE